MCERYINESDLLSHLWIVIYSFHMPLFIFVNGFFARKSKKPAEMKSIKMLKYYLLMQILFVIGNYMILGEELEISVLADPAYCCWYLLFLVYAYLFAKILPNETVSVVKWIIISLGLSLIIGFDVSVGHAYAVGRTFYFLPYFLMGALWADMKKEFDSKKIQKIVYLAVLVIVFIIIWKLGDAKWFNRAVFSGHQSYWSLYPDHIFWGLTNKMAAYMLAIFISFFVLKIIPHRKTIFCFLGRHTLLIYLVHIFLFKMEFYLIKDMRFVENKEINSAFILLLLVVSLVVICYILLGVQKLVNLKGINLLPK